jgi:peptide/nickel transport system substrate-binding protein
LRNSKAFILIIFILIIMLTSCSLPQNSASTDETSKDSAVQKSDDVIDNGPVKGGTLKLFCTSPDTLNPILTNNLYVKEFEGFIFESLVSLDKSQKPVPCLSDSWEVSSDGLIWNFHIRDKVFWHDGQPLTSEDVEFTVDTLLKNNINSVYKRNVENIANFSSVDKNNFKIILKKANSFTAELMTFPILPKHYFLGEDILKTTKNMNPVGTGPYKFASYTEKKNISLIANDNWWKAREPSSNVPNAPLIDNISINIYNDGNEQLNAFQTRDVDVVSLGPEESSRYSGRTDLTIKKFTGKSYEFVSFNLSNPLTADLAVRQAIANTVDKIKIVSDLLPGEAVASDVPVIPDTWLYDTNIVSYTPNIQTAKDILSKDGWKEDNGTLYKNINGVLTPLNLELLVNEDNETRIRVADKISEQLKDIGINLKITKLGWDDEQKLIGSHKYEMALMGWSISSIPDISFAYATNEIAAGRNIAGYSNKDVDKYLQDIILENDSNKKKALFLNMKDIINNEVPYIGLYFYDNAMLYNNRVRGVMNPYIWNEFTDITQWYLPER